MASLQPLALSAPTSPALSSSVPVKRNDPGPASADMACNLPELLARDLGASEVVFMSKSMTAGPPSRAIAVQSAGIHRDLQGHLSCIRPASRSQKTPGHMNSSGSTIEQHLLNAGHRTRMYEDDDSSDMGSESSAADEPPSIRFLRQSITTSATSVTSGRCSTSLSHQHGPSQIPHTETARRGSFLDLDPEATEENYLDHEPLKQPVRRRPNSSLGFGDPKMFRDSLTSSEATIRPKFSDPFNLPAHYAATERPHTSSGPPNEQTRIPRKSIRIPQRRSSLSYRYQPEGTGTLPDQLHSRNTSLSSTMPSAQVDIFEPPISPRSRPQQVKHVDASEEMLSPTTTAGLASPAPHLDGNKKPPASYEVTVKSKPAMDAETLRINGDEPSHVQSTSLANIHSWLESSVGLSPAARTSLVLPQAGIPLPPEVIDTLRLSTSCFPETMLLSSSLTIETIRSYSKKLKHAAAPHDGDDESIFSLPYPATGPHTNNYSRLLKLPKMMLSKKRTASLTKASLLGPSLSRPSHSHHRNASTSPGGTAQVAPPNWAPLKSIFPAGSDYLCDALYAHIVAYNYISSICPAAASAPAPAYRPSSPTGTAPSPSPRRGTFQDITTARRQSGADSDGNDDKDRDGTRIPKKAASLLGLSAAAGPADMAATNQFWRAKNRFASPAAAAGGQRDAPMRELHAALGRCVVKLVGALRGENGKGAREREETAVDPFLLRAVCEVVRVEEEF